MTAFFDSAKAIISRFDTQWAAAHAGLAKPQRGQVSITGLL
jgi:hypothetical protein